MKLTLKSTSPGNSLKILNYYQKTNSILPSPTCLALKQERFGFELAKIKTTNKNIKRNKLKEILKAFETNNLSCAFKLANKDINIKHSNPIIKGFATNDNSTFIQD